MSEIINSEYLGGIRTTQYENKRYFIFNNTFADGQLNNSDEYEPVTFRKGTLLGRIAASGILVPLDSGASDGSQYPVGVLAGDFTVEEGDTVGIRMCVSGEVNEYAIIFSGDDDFDTIVSGRTLRDRIGADTVGITLVPVEELGKF